MCAILNQTQPTVAEETKNFVQYNNLVVNYTDGDVMILDHVKNLGMIYPLKAKSNIIALCTSGDATLTIGDTVKGIRKNEVLFCPPNVVIDKLKVSPDFECKILSLSDHIFQALIRDKMPVWHRAVYVDQLNVIEMSEVCVDEFFLYYGLLRSKINNHKKPSYEIIQTLVRSILLELCSALEARQGAMGDRKLSQGRSLFNRFIQMVSDGEVKRQPITYYASQLSITPKYLTMLCLNYSNMTASDWIVKYTVDDIRFYLRSSNMSIKEVSAKLGFANMSHFGSYVRKHLGMSPSDYRHGK